MFDTLSRKWWVLFFRGCFAVVFGILAIFFPAITLTSFAVLFAIYALLNGSFALYVALSERRNDKNWRWNLADGVMSILAGLGAWFVAPLVGINPALLIGFYAIFTGITQVVIAWRLRKIISQKWLLGISGVLSILTGLFIFVFPTQGAAVLAWIVGGYAIAFGLMLMKTALSYRELRVYPHNNDFGSVDTGTVPSST